MFRKILATSLVILLTVLGFSATSPASAWEDTTSDVGTFVSPDARNFVEPVGKTLSGEMIFAYAAGQDDSYYFKSYRVSANGQISTPITIAASNNTSYWFSSKMVWGDTTGTINLIYLARQIVGDSLTTKLFYTTTKDGTSWTTPIELVSKYYETCARGLYNCGLGDAAIVGTPGGNLSLTYTLVTGSGPGEIYYTTKSLGKPWLSPTRITGTPNEVEKISLVLAGKGLLATWVERTEPYRIVSAYSTSYAAKSWTAPQERVRGSEIEPWALMQIADTKFAQVYQVDVDQKVWMQVFDSVTKRFSTAVQISDTFGIWDFTRVKATKYVGGQSALVFTKNLGSDRLEANASTIKYVVFKNGVASSHVLDASIPTTAGNYQMVQAANMDKSGHLTIVWVRTGDDSASRMYISQIYRGNRSDTDVSFPNQIMDNYWVQFSQDGDVYMTNFWISTITAKVRLRSDAPIISSNVSIAGTAKVGKALSVKLPQITASATGQAWLNSFQWFACDLQVTESLSTPTDTCVAIPGATSASFKTKAAQKGKFLQVRLSVRSDNATQVQYSTSTLVVK